MKTFCCGALGVALLVAAGAGQSGIVKTAAAQGRGAAQAPAFQVDPLWPRPLGNHWILGSVTGVVVDAQDHVWITHRGADSLGNNEKGPTLEPWASECCFPAPQILEFDPAGAVVGHWGGPGQGYEWPQNPSGIAVDAKGNVWIAAAGPPPPGPGRGRAAAPVDESGAAARGAGGPPAAGGQAGRGGGGRGGAGAGPPQPQDAQVLEFSRTGQFIRQIGHAGKIEDSNSQTGLNRPAGVAVDSAARELYVADGLGNHRVVVFDTETGAYKRHWGAYGEKPDDANLGPYDPNAAPAKQFRDVTCVKIAKDGLVYVCDRRNDRIQVFQKDGKYLKEAFVAKTTLGDGSVWDVAFSNDPQQRLLYVADGQNKKVRILQRDTLAEVSSFGQGGRLPGTFYGLGSVGVDSKGNVYTGESFEGKRVQKFVNKGMGSAR